MRLPACFSSATCIVATDLKYEAESYGIPASNPSPKQPSAVFSPQRNVERRIGALTRFQLLEITPTDPGLFGDLLLRELPLLPETKNGSIFRFAEHFRD